MVSFDTSSIQKTHTRNRNYQIIILAYRMMRRRGHLRVPFFQPNKYFCDVQRFLKSKIIKHVLEYKSSAQKYTKMYNKNDGILFAILSEK